MGDVLLHSCKGNICRTENTRNHNIFLVIVEWKAHEIFKTWSWDFIFKYFNCQHRTVLVYFWAPEISSKGGWGWWRGRGRMDKKKQEPLEVKTTPNKRQREINVFFSWIAYCSLHQFWCHKMRHALCCVFSQKSQTETSHHGFEREQGFPFLMLQQHSLHLGWGAYHIS